MSTELLRAENIVKTFGQVQAVKNGQFTLRKGEIHSLVQFNQSGEIPTRSFGMVSRK